MIKKSVNFDSKFTFLEHRYLHINYINKSTLIIQ